MAKPNYSGISVTFGREKGKKYILSYNIGKKQRKNYSGVEVYINLKDSTARIKPAKNIEEKVK